MTPIIAPESQRPLHVAQAAKPACSEGQGPGTITAQPNGLGMDCIKNQGLKARPIMVKPHLMKKNPAILFTLGISAAAISTPAAEPTVTAAPAKPNIIFILTDDLGYGDIGAFYQNARRDSDNRAQPWHATPQLDRMAAEGVRLTHHYCAAPVCAPSRASILSGLSQGHANVRNNQFDKALANNHTVATVLRQAGYTTAAIGKWGLQGHGAGPDWPAHPLNRGFDYYYGYMRHIDGHEHYPKEQIYFAEKRKKNGDLNVWENRTTVTDGLDKCYTTDLFTARAKSWIVDHRNTAPGKPFFMYLAFDTPHAVLELPTQAYPSGGGLNGGMQWLGKPGHMINTASGKPDSWIHPDYDRATYLRDGKQKPWPDVNKRYATSVRRIDDAVGDLLQLLKDLNIDQNTLIVFTSDNGPADESYLPERITPEFFSSFGPFDGLKRDTWEGGLRVPVIVRWPGHIAANTSMSAPSAQWDWLPTFAEVAHISAPAKTDGRSLLGNLTGRTANGRGTGQADDYLYFEYFFAGRTPNYAGFEPGHRNRLRNQMQAVRRGDYTAVRYDVKNANDDFEIYNVVTDPKETRNLGGKREYAAMQADFKALALQARRPDLQARRPYDATPVPALTKGQIPAQTKPGLAWSYYEGDFPWVPDCTNLRPVQTGATAAGPDLATAPLRRGQNAAISYQGYLSVPADGEYTFELSADTGALMRLHNITVIDADYGYKSGAAPTASIQLKAGLHPFTLIFLTDGKGEPALSLRWHSASFEMQTIPRAVFLH